MTYTKIREKVQKEVDCNSVSLNLKQKQKITSPNNYFPQTEDWPQKVVYVQLPQIKMLLIL